MKIKVSAKGWVPLQESLEATLGFTDFLKQDQIKSVLEAGMCKNKPEAIHDAELALLAGKIESAEVVKREIVVTVEVNDIKPKKFRVKKK